jgi:transposase, IS30 family
MEKIKKGRKPFRHMTQSDRDRIEALKNEGHLQKEIARILKFNESAISREIRQRRRQNGYYDATRAQEKADIKRSNSKYQGMKIEKYPQLKERIISELKNHRSPDEIAGRLEKEKILPRVKANAIYKWLYSVWGQAHCKYLCTQRYKIRKQKKTSKREMIPNRTSLKERPAEGRHAEGDLFVSPAKTGALRSGAIICVPSAQLLVGTMIENKKSNTMVDAVIKMVSKVAIDDLTMDNGIENRGHKQFGLPTFFADPHAPWQKPNVENNIGLLRKWFIKKKTNLNDVSEDQFQQYLHILNGKYRKSLGYRSAYEVAMENGIIQKIPALERG